MSSSVGQVAACARPGAGEAFPLPGVAQEPYDGAGERLGVPVRDERGRFPDEFGQVVGTGRDQGDAEAQGLPGEQRPGLAPA